MMTATLLFASVLLAEPQAGSVRLQGPVADRMDAMIANQVMKTDPCYLTRPFHSQTEKAYFHTEFWGKYMHSAPYFWKYTGCPRLKETIRRGVDDLLAAQLPDGYIGYYSPSNRLARCTWDVWGCKYTLLGLETWYDVTGEKRALDAAVRLGDYLIRWFDPKAGHAPLHETGWVAGLASCSLLEPIVGLAARTGESRFLDFARDIVRECDVDGPTGAKAETLGPALITPACAGVPVADRGPWDDGRGNRRKAYEMMSCYQGLLDFYGMTGEKRVFDAAFRTVDDIITNEITLAGSGSCREYWDHGRARQYLPFTRHQETCVTTTWMRLLERMLLLTGDPRYADEIERAFYNAYLAALKPDGSFFVTYTPLFGYRLAGQNHCFMFTNCCNANGPRGFLVFLEALLRATGDAAIFNLYNSARCSVNLPALGRAVDFDVYTLYPKDGNVKIWNRTKGDADFTLKLRIPAWSGKTVVKVNGKTVAEKPVAGRYLELRRTWREGDAIEIDFDMSVRMHLLDHYAAFTTGPILLARDTRFGDGDLAEVLSYDLIDSNYATPWLKGSDRAKPPFVPAFAPERVSLPGQWMCFSARLPLGCHPENPEGKFLSTVRFCDFASAGAEWSLRNSYRTWFPIEYVAWE